MRLLRFAFALLILTMLVLPIHANEDTVYTAGDFDTDSILDSLDDDVRARLPDGDIFDSDGFSNRFSAGYFFSLIGDAFSAALAPALKTLGKTLGLLIISSALSSLKKMLDDVALASVFETASTLCLMLTLYTAIASIVNQVSTYLIQLNSAVNTMLPVTVAIGMAGGNMSASAVSGSAMMLGVTFVEFIAANGLYPILQLCFGMAAVSGIGRGFELGAINRLVRTAFVWVLGFVSAVISAVMTFQTSIAARADSLSMRAVKFAASKAIPVAGGIAGDAVSTVAESLSLVRGTVGWVGVIIIIVMTLPVIANVILVRLGIVISNSAAEVLGLEKEKAVLSEAVGLLGFLAAVCVIAAIMFIYALALFANSAAALA